SRDILSI
ncbi:unnamed protein product, partial [Allacma fusca]